MNKLFKLAQAKGKWHKSPSFNLEVGVKLCKNFAKKLLAVSLCAAVVLLGVPMTTFAEGDQPEFTVDPLTGFITAVTVDDPTSITEIVIPATDQNNNNNPIKGVAPGVFDKCTSLREFAVEDGHTFLSVGSCGELLGRAENSSPHDILYRLPPAYGAAPNGVVTYTLPDTVTEIQNGAFTNCSRLETFNLGDYDSELTWSDFSFTGCSSLAEFVGSRGGFNKLGFLSGSVAVLRQYGTSGWCPVRVAPGAVGPVVLGFDSDAADGATVAAAALDGCDSLTAVLCVCPFRASETPLVPSGLPLLVPDRNLTSSSFDAVDACVIGYEVVQDDTTRLLLTSRSGDTDKALELACTTFNDYTLAIKDGVTEADLNLTLKHTGDPGSNCSACGATIPTVPVTDVSLDKDSLELTAGESATLTATVSPANATDQSVIWTTSNEFVADVSSNGCVTAMGPGTATITVDTGDGGFTAECKVTVTGASGDPQPTPSPSPSPNPNPTPTPQIDRSSWGTPYVREADGVTQYVVEDPNSPDFGMTSVELDPERASAHGAASVTYWLRESSGSTSAWYGLTLHLSTCHPGYRFYVQWLSPGDPGYDALFAKLDDAAKQRIEDDNGWIFNMGIRDPDGHDLHYITAPNGVSTQPIVYVQIGDDWDVNDLNAYYIAAGGDETVPVDYLMLDYPGGTDTFGRMTLEHFSPYIIFDELTDAEKAARNVTTGDLTTQMMVAGLGMTLVLALGIMLRLIAGKKSFEK